MKISQFGMKKINLSDVDKSYSGQNILLKLGELYQFESGIYAYGNLWTKLERAVEEIIIDELDKAGCVQVEFPILQPRSIWDRSNRWEMYTSENDIMYTMDNNFGEYGLGPTAEECATVFGSNRLLSYKNLPVVYYQINQKFRKEIRARGYLFRPRTFIMMDAYSFDLDEEGMQKTYEKMHDVYMKIFKRLGINIIPTVSDNGTMGGNQSEEFQAITALGEDIVLYDENEKVGINKEVLDFEDRDKYIEQSGIKDISKLKEYQATELGNNFQLGTKYSESMKLFYKDKEGKDKPFYMGCYGIGLGRIIACLIENNIIKDGEKIKGFSLPVHMAPYKVQIVYSEENKEVATKLYNDLEEKGIHAIIDDREKNSIGEKIKDCYVLGTPYLAIMGRKFDGENVEVEVTSTGEKKVVKLSDFTSLFQK